MLFRSAAMRMIRIGYIPHGPLVDWHNDEQIDVLFNQIDFAAYEHRAGMVKMEPYVWQNALPEGRWDTICATHELITETDTIQPPRTVIIDIRGSEEEILARMKSKTRYNIRLSARKEVTVRQGTIEDLAIFYNLMLDTGQRGGFSVHAPEYYSAAFELFSPHNVTLLIAEYAGQPLAAIMVFKHGKQASYLYGASSEIERQRMPTYALQWAAIQWAREQGCTFYDLWGVPDAEPDELEAQFNERNDDLWGVYRAKRGYGGDVLRTVGCADRVYNNLTYRLYKRRRARQR
jgi:lipid II:glycine glycyltransferase (peptidoglycan interpeptide bridge formation enzyme)